MPHAVQLHGGMPEGHHVDRQHRAAEARHAIPREISEAMSAFQVQARKYRGQFSGMTAHVAQRATGLLLLAYLFLHVHTIRELRDGPAAFNAALATFHSPFFKLLE